MAGINRQVVSVPCKHWGGDIQHCKTCKGTGFVNVAVGWDGQPRPCTHRGGEIRNCHTCKGSGWAGIVD
nr:hypothetical protein [uncultured Methanoregula sp.]